MDTTTTATIIGSGRDMTIKTEQFRKGIRATASSLSPISQPQKSSLSQTVKASMSTGNLSLTRNKISFGEVKTLVFEKEIDGQDEHQKNAVWYSKKEMKSIRKDLKKSIRKGELTRGLEQYDGDFGEENQQKRMNHVYSILDLQREQQQKGIYDDEGIQMLSRTMSVDHMAKARRLASMDSIEAFHEHQKIRNRILRTSSQDALDNLRKTLSVNVKSKRKGSSKRSISLDDIGPRRAAAARSSGGPEGKNTPFETLKQKPLDSNLLHRIMEDKRNEKMMVLTDEEAGTACLANPLLTDLLPTEPDIYK